MPTSYSWPLVPDPTPSVPDAPETAAQQAASAAERGLPSYLGQGLLRPFRRDEKNDFANGSGPALVKSAVGQVLGTKASTAQSPGECPWDTEFGSRLHILRHRNNPQLAGVIAQEALSKWEPRITVTTARIDPSTNPRERILSIGYRIIRRGGGTALFDDRANVPLESSA